MVIRLRRRNENFGRVLWKSANALRPAKTPSPNADTRIDIRGRFLLGIIYCSILFYDYYYYHIPLGLHVRFFFYDHHCCVAMIILCACPRGVQPHALYIEEIYIRFIAQLSIYDVRRHFFSSDFGELLFIFLRRSGRSRTIIYNIYIYNSDNTIVVFG